LLIVKPISWGDSWGAEDGFVYKIFMFAQKSGCYGENVRDELMKTGIDEV
jgi:hypothetical protein